MSFRDTVTGLFVSAKNAASRPKVETVKETFRRSEDHRILREALDKNWKTMDREAAHLMLIEAIDRVLNRP